MEFPEGLLYSKEHEWVLVEGNSATIGITEFAQEELGDVVYVELPEVGEKIVKDDPFGAVESVKAVSDIYAPVSGTVLEINDVLPDSPETINDDTYGDGWMIRVEMNDKDDLKDLKAQIKGDGYNVVALTRLVAIRRNKRRADLEAELLNDLILYAHATGTPLDVAFGGDESEAPPEPARGREAVEDEA